MLSNQTYLQELQEWTNHVLKFWTAASAPGDDNYKFKYDMIGPPSKPSEEDLIKYAEEIHQLGSNSKCIVYGATEELTYLLLLKDCKVVVVDFCQGMIDRLNWYLTDGINILNNKLEPLVDKFDLKLLYKSKIKNIKNRVSIQCQEWHEWTRDELLKNDWEPKYDFVCCDSGIPTFLYGNRDYQDLLDKFTSLIKRGGTGMFRAHVHEPNNYSEPPGSIEGLLDRVHNIMESNLPENKKYMGKEKAIREYCSNWTRDTRSGILNYNVYQERLKEHKLSQEDYKLLTRPLAELGDLRTYVPEPGDFGGPLLDAGFEIVYTDPTGLHSPICIAKRV